jgi:hypothetical protein
MRRSAALLAAFCLLIAITSSAFALAPRTPLPKEPLRVIPDTEQRLVVKFADALRVRADAGGNAVALSGANLAAIAELAVRHQLHFQPLIPLPEALIRGLEERAVARSGREQPDLAGMMIVSPAAAMSAAELAVIGEALEALPEVEFAYLETLGNPPPGDIAPVTPDLVSHQTYRGVNPGMDVNGAWAAGVTGAGVRLSDCEYGWDPAHEDLNDRNLHLEPGQTIHPDVFLNGWEQHGTAVLGEISSDVNAYGTSGMAPDAVVYTWPEWTVEGGQRRVACITHAIAASAPGDVVVLEMQANGAGGGYGPAELELAVWTAVKTGTDAGILVVGAAGNGNQNLDSPAYQPYMNRGDSGAIIVGAGSSTVNHTKLSFSTYGSRVNVQGWGQNVFTLGYGDYAQYGGDIHQGYTATFDGTSSATPFVASACVELQSLALAVRDVPLTPLQLRQLLIDTGWPQGGVGGHIGPFPNLTAAFNAYYATYATDVHAAVTRAAARVALSAQPNPVRGATSIRYALAAPEPVTLRIYDTAGRRIRELAGRDHQLAGTHEVTWNGDDDSGRRVASGVYFVRLEAGSHSETGRVVLLH